MDLEVQETDYEGLEAAAIYIATRLIKFGRIRTLQSKVKYEEVRVYIIFGFSSLYCFYIPWAFYSTSPGKLKWMDYIKLSWLNPLVIPYQQFIYRLVYKKAVAKWPHLRNNIISGADFENLLTGI